MKVEFWGHDEEAPRDGGGVSRIGSPKVLDEADLKKAQTLLRSGDYTKVQIAGIRLRRDSWMSVMYAEGLHSTTSSATLQRTDRHEILGQKPADFQVSL